MKPLCKFLYLPVITLFLFLYTSCTTTYKVTKNYEECMGFELGKTYLTKRDVFLIKPDSEAHVAMFNEGIIVENETSKMVLVPEKAYKRIAGLYTSPESIEEYKKDPFGSVILSDAYSVIDVVGIVPKNTEIKALHHKKTVGYSWWWGPVNFYNTYGEILSGDFKGHVVELDDIGTLFRCSNNDEVIRVPDTNLLKLMEK